jgi:hypothetical protein
MYILTEYLDRAIRTADGFRLAPAWSHLPYPSASVPRIYAPHWKTGCFWE